MLFRSVYLFTSSTYADSCSLMKFECSNYIADLNINKTIQTSAPINGEQKYWRAKMMYKMDNKDWVIKESITYLVDANGNVIR